VGGRTSHAREGPCALRNDRGAGRPPRTRGPVDGARRAQRRQRPNRGVFQDVSTCKSQAERIPSKGHRIELLTPRRGRRPRGTVFYSDHLQILVKWDDGRSQSLRPGVDRFLIIDGRA
jgi:hypothetical protein